MEPPHCDCLVIGSGLAGSAYALQAARAGLKVEVLSLGSALQANSDWAQGGIIYDTTPEPDRLAQDIVAIFVSATGDIGGRHTERTYAKIVRHKEIGGHHWTAIQITTACGITAVLDLLREGKLPSHGFVRNEDVAFSDFIANRFGKHYG